MLHKKFRFLWHFHTHLSISLDLAWNTYRLVLHETLRSCMNTPSSSMKHSLDLAWNTPWILHETLTASSWLISRASIVAACRDARTCIVFMCKCVCVVWVGLCIWFCTEVWYAYIRGAALAMLKTHTLSQKQTGKQARMHTYFDWMSNPDCTHIHTHTHAHNTNKHTYPDWLSHPDCAHIHTHTCIRARTHHTHTHTHTNTDTHTHAHAHNTNTHTHIFKHTHSHTHTHTHAHTAHKHTHTLTGWPILTACTPASIRPSSKLSTATCFVRIHNSEINLKCAFHEEGNDSRILGGLGWEKDAHGRVLGGRTEPHRACSGCAAIHNCVLASVCVFTTRWWLSSCVQGCLMCLCAEESVTTFTLTSASEAWIFVRCHAFHMQSACTHSCDLTPPFVTEWLHFVVVCNLLGEWHWMPA